MTHLFNGKRLMIVALLLTFWLSQTSFFTPFAAKAADQSPVVDLVIQMNLPEVEAAVEGETLQLVALHVFADGHFAKVNRSLQWSSSNKNVATVDNQGFVRLLNHNGRTFIQVTDGQFADRIAIDYNRGSQPAAKVVKEIGERYQLISKAISGMTLEEKIGQLLMPDFRKYEGKDVTTMLPQIAKQIQKYHVGGVILFRENVVNTEQTVRLVNDYQQAAEKYGLLISIDQEGGIVTRLQEGTDLPGNMAIGATRSVELARAAGDVIGQELAALGINTDFAPDLDVNNNPDNPVIGVRSFASDPQLVAELGIAYVQGLQQNGIAATAKHFPGHGDTAVDSHLGLPEVPHDMDRLLQIELYPFKQAIEQGVDAIMTAHVTFPKIDDTKVVSQKDGTLIALPATLSPKVITGLIRDQLGFDGVVSTDAMNMQAIADHFGPVDAAVRAVKAGVDIILMPVGLAEVSEGLKQAVNNGEISEQRIEQSVRRILTLKVKRGIFKTEQPSDLAQMIQTAKQIVGSPEHRATEAEIAGQSITLVKNEQILPLAPNQNRNLLVVGSSYVNNLAAAIKRYNPRTAVADVSEGKWTDELKNKLAAADAVIIGSYSATAADRSPTHPVMALYRQLLQSTDKPVIVVAIRNPYDISALTEADAYLAQYGFREASFKAAAAVLFGETKPTGKLPVAIPGLDGKLLYPFGFGLEYGQ